MLNSNRCIAGFIDFWGLSAWLERCTNSYESKFKKKEVQYFYDLNLRLKKNHVLLPKEDSLTKDNRLKERAIQRWETDGGVFSGSLCAADMIVHRNLK